MAKRKPLTKTRAEAVDNLITAFISVGVDFDGFDLERFLQDYKDGLDITGEYRLMAKPVIVKTEPKTPWWKILLGLGD